MVMPNKVYDILKNISVVLPIIATAYFGLSQIWGFPYGEQIVGSLTIIETALLSLLKASSVKYNKEKEKEEKREEFEKTLNNM